MLAFSLTIFPCGKPEDCSESLYFLEIFRRGREKLHCDDYDSDEQTTKIISLGLILILVGEDTHRCVGFYEEDQLGRVQTNGLVDADLFFHGCKKLTVHIV